MRIALSRNFVQVKPVLGALLDGYRQPKNACDLRRLTLGRAAWGKIPHTRESGDATPVVSDTFK